MGKFLEVQGCKSVYLTALRVSHKNKYGEYMWECLCKCGKKTYVKGSDIKWKRIKSCGCYRNEVTSKRTKKHGMSQSDIYNIWCHIKARCYRKSCISYKNYGGRGIKMCNRWKRFDNFYDDMNKTYKKGLTIERVDVNKGYNINNCIWIPFEEQSKNTRRTVYLTCRGKKLSAIEWSKISGTKVSIILARKKRGWDIYDAIFGRLKSKAPVIRHNEQHRK